MGETLPLFAATCNCEVETESRPEHLTIEGSAPIKRELQDRLGIIDSQIEHLDDDQDASRVTYLLSDLIRVPLLRLGQSCPD